MKGIKRHLLLLLIVTVITTMCFGTVYANVSSASNAISVNLNSSTKMVWDSNNSSDAVFYKFVTTERGFLDFRTTKIKDSYNNTVYYDLELYDESGNKIWGTSTYNQINSFFDYYEYYIGLNPGTYFMSIDPSISLWSDDKPISAKYEFLFVTDENAEIEPNGTTSMASKITLGTSINGYYGEEDYDTNYSDTYAVELKKNKLYKVEIENYEELTRTTMIPCIINPNKEKSSLSYEMSDDGVAKFFANYSGTYYLQLSNASDYPQVKYSLKVTNIPFKNKISSLKNDTSKAITVKVSKNSYATGYQVQYSTSSSFSSKKSVKFSTTSKKIKGLTKGKTYYVRVRPYYEYYNDDFDLVKVYGSWSSAKKIKISK